VAIFNSLIEGVLASLVAVVIIEIYRIVRRSLSYRAIRSVLEGSGRFGIVAPSYPHTRSLASAGLLTTDNAFALAEIIDVCRKLGAEPVLSPVARIADNFPDDMILLGGHIANDLTGRFLSEYCTGFKIHGTLSDQPDQASETIYYSCGERKFIDSSEDAWAFVAKLSSDLTGNPRTIVMVWGRSSFGSAAAAHFLARRTRLLNAKQGQSLFYALRMSRQLHYQSLPTEIANISEKVFTRLKKIDHVETPS
jgi:hypothetical protein